MEILKDKPISFEEAKSRNNDNLDDDEDEDFTPYKYYPSNKILGKLYNAIDEREIFGRVQHHRLEQSLQRRTASNTARSVLESVWDYVNSRFPFAMLDDHLARARGIRDE